MRNISFIIFSKKIQDDKLLLMDKKVMSVVHLV